MKKLILITTLCLFSSVSWSQEEIESDIEYLFEGVKEEIEADIEEIEADIESLFGLDPETLSESIEILKDAFPSETIDLDCEGISIGIIKNNFVNVVYVEGSTSGVFARETPNAYIWTESKNDEQYRYIINRKTLLLRIINLGNKEEKEMQCSISKIKNQI